MQQIIIDNLEKIAELCRTHHVLRLSVFGSAVRDDFNLESSDVDFLVDFEPPGSFRYARNFFGLQRSLSLLLNRDVDLVISHTVENPIILESIEEDKRLLYANVSSRRIYATSLRPCNESTGYTGGLDREAFGATPLVQDAVIRRFEIIGEAIVQCRRHYPEEIAKLGDVQEVVDFRNHLVHRYHKVAADIVWDIVQEDLPPLLNFSRKPCSKERNASRRRRSFA